MRSTALELAQKQYGLLSLDQGRELGYSENALRSSWDRFLPTVFRRPEVPGSWYQQGMGLTLWGGGETALSHQSAAALLRFKGFTPGEVHVVSVRNARRLPGWAHVHHMSEIPPGGRKVRGIPVLPPWITMLQVCGIVPRATAGSVFDDGLFRGMFSLPQMAWVLATHGGSGHRGSGVLHDLIEERSTGTRYVPPESELEALLYKLVESAVDIPPAERQHWEWDGTQWRRFDLAWPAVRLLIEVDGWDTHGSREAFQADRRRDAMMVAMGWRVLRFTWDDIVNRPDYVLTTIRRALCQNNQK